MSWKRGSCAFGNAHCCSNPSLLGIKFGACSASPPYVLGCPPALHFLLIDDIADLIALWEMASSAPAALPAPMANLMANPMAIFGAIIALLKNAFRFA